MRFMARGAVLQGMVETQISQLLLLGKVKLIIVLVMAVYTEIIFNCGLMNIRKEREIEFGGIVALYMAVKTFVERM